MLRFPLILLTAFHAVLVFAANDHGVFTKRSGLYPGNITVDGYQYLLVEGGQCEDLQGCSTARNQTECGSWITFIKNVSSEPVKPAINPAPRCYIFGDSAVPYFNSASVHALEMCSSSRKCVCRCSQSATQPTINVALYTGSGDSVRGKANIRTVLNYASDIRVLNFTAMDVARHLDSAVYDVVLFPGGGGGTQAHALTGQGLASVKAFLADGKGYVGICAGAFLAIQHLKISFVKDSPRPADAPKGGRGDGNVTVTLTDNGTTAMGQFNVSRAGLASELLFYANGPVMVTSDTPVGVTAPQVLLRFSSASVPIEKNYTGKTSGHGDAAVVSNMFNGGGVVISGPHPETNQLNFPAQNGPPSRPGSVEAELLQAYVRLAHSLGAWRRKAAASEQWQHREDREGR
jgi:hypothetical protein